MPIKFGLNISSLKAQNELRKANDALSRTFERLSSGLRINRASDDPAGAAVAAGLNSEARILTQAVRNANEGISLLSVAEGGLSALSTIVARLQELSQQAANGTFTSAQRSAIDDEAQALSAEYSRIISTTSYNGTLLLNSSSSIAIQVGGDGSANSRIQVDLSNLLTRTPVGDGTFAAETTFNSGARTNQITSGDLNGDGFQDLVASDLTAADRINVMFGNGNGTFKAGVAYFTGVSGNYFSNLILADINNDGISDVVVDGVTDHNVGVLLGNSNGSFKAALTYAAYGTGVGEDEGLEVADFNGDGKLDYLVGSDTSGDSLPDVISLRLGNGDGTFKAATSIGVSSMGRFGSGDLNGDGRRDLVVNTSTGNRVLLGNGDGTFTVGSILTSHNGYANRGFNLVDLNGDGKLDLAGYYPTGVNPSYLGVALGNGDGTFKAIASYTTTNAINHNDYNLKATDLNGDNRPDLILATGTAGKIEVRLNDGSGGFSTVTTLTTGDNDSFTINDFNEDGILDIARGSYAANTIGILLGNGGTNSAASLSLNIDLSTVSGARSAISSLDTVADSISAALGKVGAYQSRLDTSVGLLESTVANYRTAEARIVDADVAAEVAQMVRLQILQSAATSILAQANQEPAIALKLLQ